MIQRLDDYRNKAHAILVHKDTRRKILSFAARWNLPWVAARMLATLSQPIVKDDGTPKTGPSRILVLNSGKDEFLRDILEVFSGDDRFELVQWPQYALPAIADTILYPGLRHDTYVTNNPEVEATKPRYRRFALAMWRHLQRIQPFAAVISPNFGYRVQRELAFALEQYGTPFVVLQKENLNAATEHRREFWRGIYRERRGKFGGRKILVYNQMECDLELSSGIVTPSQVEVVGMARLDRFHRWRREHAGPAPAGRAAKVTFFSFSRSDKIPVEAGLSNGWGGFCTDTHRAMVDLARARPDIHVYAKTKGLTRQDEELLAIVNAGEEAPPANFHITSGGDAFELMAESRVVVGFNTTGVLEALALGKPVIVPRFGEAVDPVLRKFVIDVGDAADYADSPAQLRELVLARAIQPLNTPLELPERVKKILQYWLGNEDGLAGRRAYEAICREIKPA
ncbi:MAG: hypothetical protein HXY30_06610 [Pseudorhodoplanes sp.]|nr:hypothetical protein [Pseudorhodoplanes sp.]